MKMILHIIRKDLRQLWPHLLLWLVATLVGDVFSLQLSERGRDGFSVMGPVLCVIPSWILWVSFFPALVHLDPPNGTSTFWMTRPISSAAIFIAKLIEALLLAVVLTCVVHGLFLFSQGFQWSQVMFALGVFAIGLLLCGGPLFFMASLTRTIPRFWFVILGFAVVGSGAMKFLAGSRGNVMILLPIGGIVLAAFQYWHRRAPYGIVSAVIVAACILGLSHVSARPLFETTKGASNQRVQLPWMVRPAFLNGLPFREEQGSVFVPLQVSVPPGESVSAVWAKGETKWSTGITTHTNTDIETYYAPGVFPVIQAALGDDYRLVGRSTDNLLDIPVASGTRGNAYPISFRGEISGRKVRVLFLGKSSVKPTAMIARGGHKFIVDETPTSGRRHRLVTRYQMPRYGASASATGSKPIVLIVDPQKKEARVLDWTEEYQMIGLVGLDVRRYKHEFSVQGSLGDWEQQKGIVAEGDVAVFQIWVFAAITDERVNLPIACTFPAPVNTPEVLSSSSSKAANGSNKGGWSELKDVDEARVYEYSDHTVR